MCASLFLPIRRRSAGFTLIELMVCISIAALMIAMLLPVLQSARAAARAVLCKSQEQQMGRAIHLYLTDNDGVLGKPGHAWTYLYDDYLGAVSYEGRAYSPLWLCPAHPLGNVSGGPLKAEPYWGDNRIGYMLNVWMVGSPVGGSGQNHGNAAHVDAIRNPASKVLIAEHAYPDCATSYKTTGYGVSTPGHFGHLYFGHRGAMNLLWADGHVADVRAEAPFFLVAATHPTWKRIWLPDE